MALWSLSNTWSHIVDAENPVAWILPLICCWCPRFESRGFSRQFFGRRGLWMLINHTNTLKICDDPLDVTIITRFAQNCSMGVCLHCVASTIHCDCIPRPYSQLYSVIHWTACFSAVKHTKAIIEYRDYVLFSGQFLFCLVCCSVKKRSWDCIQVLLFNDLWWVGPDG